ncbi:tetratricopeptide repeat protein [candidate division WOR-3 bacterium]|nr:tetratricopeptide repeat protein [candidate division WOR-3 bacterium]
MRSSVGVLQPSQVVSGRYQVIACLGGGDTTEVYKVKDIVGGKVLAMKVLCEDASKDAELRLSREFYYLSRFAHPGIVSAYDYGTTPEHRPFFTMEFFEGVPLNVFFPKGYVPELADVTLQVLAALDTIHAQGLIHCDIKPQHVLVVEEEGRPRAKLLDFGFADKVSLADSMVPRGTLGYVAPEVFKGIDADARADLYSLGMVLYETVTGRGPAQEKNLRQWLKMQYYSEFEPPRRFDPKIPESFEGVVVSLISREPERRPRSAAAVIETLAGRVVDGDEEAGGGPRKYLMAPGFIGRSEFLGRLRSRLEAAGQGKAGVVCLSGERGVGKSRLLAEFRFAAQLEGATILAFEPVSLGARPQSLIETVLGYLRVYSSTGLTIADEGGTAVSEESKYRLFETVTQRLKELSASHRVGHSLVLLVDDFELFDPTSLEFLRYLVFSLGPERLMVLVAGLKEKRFLDLIGEFERRPYFEHVPLPPMQEAEVGQLVVSLLGELAHAETLNGWLMTTTGGNPLFVLETVHSLIEGRVLVPRGTHWFFVPDALRAYRPPDSVTDVVKRRLENLSREEMEILQVGAAAGGPFALDFLRAVLSLDERVLFNAIGRLKALGLLRSFAGDGEASFALSSKILEAVVTERLSVQQRRENHRRVALALELLHPEKQDRLVFDLAHHYTQAGIADRAHSYSLRAGAKAREYHLLEQALGFYEAALALSAQSVPPRERIELIETVGELREATGRYAEAIDSYTQGMSIVVADKVLAREKQLLARLLRKLGLVHQKQAHNDEALSLFNQALLMQVDKSAPEYVQILNDLGWSYCSVGGFEKSEGLLTQALQLAEKLRQQDPAQYNRLTSRTLYYFSVLAWSRCSFVLALQLAERSLGIYEAMRDDHNIGKISQFIATLWWRRGELDKARDYYQRYLPAQRKSGDVYFLLRSLQGLGIISQDEGEWERAYDFFAEAYTLAERIGDTPAMGELASNLGMACDERGDWDAAHAHLERAIELQGRIGSAIRLFNRVAVRANLSQLRAKRGDLEGAERLLAEAAGLAEGSEDPDLRYHVAMADAEWAVLAEKHDRARRALVRALLAARRERDWRKLANLFTLASRLRVGAGEFARAADDARRALLLLNDYPSSKEYAVALRCSGLAKCFAEKPERGTQEVKRSVELLREMGSKYELGLSLLASAQSLTVRNRGELTVDLKMPLSFRPVPQQEVNEAMANLREAQEVFRALGARLDAQRADELLNTLTQVSATMQLKARERGEYLKVFYQLSELINLELEKEDFLERILDLVIEVTKAERGLLFLLKGDRLVPAAARNVDHSTFEDAESVSHSVLRKVKRRGELVFSTDAVSDPRFNSSNSVMLNKIHSLLCAPLRVDNRVVGTIYLDSRITAHLFLEEDKNLLMSVANLLAATIDKSAAFKKLQEAIKDIRDDILVDAVTGCFLGRSKAIRDVYRVIERIAPTDCTVLLTGETGTGKGVLARLMHSKSERRGSKFVSVNCGTLPETLFESELFGHARGSFTGAVKDKEGLLEAAEGGTVFLDEVSNTTLGTQAKLLQVLEEKVIRRVGETQARRVDVRLVCATNRVLEEEVAAGRFREDLFYRMNVVAIVVPPLRDRTGDIPLLANYFLGRYANQLNKPVAGFDDGVIAAFAAYNWPGNIRELQNAIERAMIMTQKRRVALEDIGGKFAGFEAKADVARGRKTAFNRSEVVAALKETNGNVSRAADLLSTHRRQLQRLLKRYRIDRATPQ